jgi:hypothetical protein
MTGKLFSFASAAHQVNPAQFFDRVRNAEPDGRSDNLLKLRSFNFKNCPHINGFPLAFITPDDQCF